jgi:iron complex outermembrane receptor protein
MSWRLPAWGTSILVLFGALSASPCNAAERATAGADRDTIYVLPGIDVEEERPATDLEATSGAGVASVQIVDELPSRITTTSELLSTTPGVHVRRYGGMGAYSAVSIRGSNPNQVSFYLDGVPLNQSQFGVVNAADLPLAALERVEVYRSAAPVRFADAGGGVVHLVTRQAEKPEARARLSYGDFDTRHGNAWVTLARPRASLFASYGLLGSRGAFFFLDDNATPFNAADDEIALRQNNAFEQHGLTAKLDIALGSLAAAGGPPSPRISSGSAGRLILGVDFFTKHTGLPGISAYQASLARFDTRRAMASATWESPAFVDRSLELRTQIFGLSVREEFRDLENELGTGEQSTGDRTDSYGLRQEGWITAGPWQQRLGLVGEWKREEYQPRNLLAEEERGRVSRRDVMALGAETRLVPWDSRVSLFGDIRYEKAGDEFPEGPAFAGGPSRASIERVSENARFHLGLLLALPAGLSLRANAASANRLPSLFELYGNRGTVVGNRDLVSERVDTQDLGLGWGTRPEARLRAGTQLSMYRTDARDLILFVQNSQNTSVAQNVAGALLQGVEAAFSLGFGGLSLSANWTHQYTQDRSPAPFWNGNQLPGRPPHELFSRTQFETRRWRLFHEYDYVSENYLDRANRRRVEARHLHHAGAGLFLVSRSLELTAEVRNLTDNQVHDVSAYPLPGRAFAITLEARL